ncbi:helix-turn-helix domain-containing protein (plasmid) [Xanthomonas hortorum pv. hederae]|uniref:helix-turn-helix domain-containing protein n=1 Tax=Xanthomonas hortorum TaxID=56454 RepID=UPI0035A93D45
MNGATRNEGLECLRNPGRITVVRFGYAAIPSILLQGQRRLGLNNTQAMICIHLLDYWHHEDRRPFPSKRDLARRMGVTEKTIQTNISALGNL